MLPNLRIASPCSANWDRMVGDERVRYCPECKLNVYNFSAMLEGDIQRLTARRDGRLCARWFRRADGTMLTADCPVGFRARVRRISLVAGTALSAFMGVGTARAQQKGDTSSSPSASPSLVQIDRARQAKGTILVSVVDASGAVIPNAKISVVNPAGTIVAQGSTNFEGEFQVTGLSNSPYTVQAESLGFKRTEMKDIIPSASTIPVQMTVDMATMGVIVTVDSEVPVTHDETAVQDSLPLALEPAPKQNFMRRLFSRVSSSAK